MKNETKEASPDKREGSNVPFFRYLFCTSWEDLCKHQGISSLVFVSLILVPYVLQQVFILLGEI